MFRRVPSRRAIAAWFKLHGRRLERRWPFIPRAEGSDLNLGFDDILEFQYARSRDFFFLSVGAYDGLQNDPLSRFTLSHPCRGVLLEPQPAIFARLRENIGGSAGFVLLNAAIDRTSGHRTMYHVPSGQPGMPEWVEQIASFDYSHVAAHEDRAPGLTHFIRTLDVPTISFDDLLDRHAILHVDVLHIDAEGFDAEVISWFPFHRLKPGVIYYEIAHLGEEALSGTRVHLQSLGYVIRPSDSPMDEIAVNLGRT